MESIGIQGICFDEKSSFLKGAAKAPPLIRQILHDGSSNYYTELGINIEDSRIEDHGDFEVTDYLEIQGITSSNLQVTPRLLTLGGDHSITYPVVKALEALHGPLDILHFDAHGDLYPEYDGDPYSHACPFARILEEGLCRRLVQIGIRALTPVQREQIHKYGVEVVEMKDLETTTVNLNFKGPLYISMDLDVFDPGFAPGVSHHEPGGMSSRQVLHFIHQLSVPIAGADLVEHNPSRDLGGITGSLAAKLSKEILGKMLVI